MLYADVLFVVKSQSNSSKSNLQVHGLYVHTRHLNTPNVAEVSQGTLKDFYFILSHNLHGYETHFHNKVTWPTFSSFFRILRFLPLVHLVTHCLYLSFFVLANF